MQASIIHLSIKQASTQLLMVINYFYSPAKVSTPPSLGVGPLLGLCSTFRPDNVVAFSMPLVELSVSFSFFASIGLLLSVVFEDTELNRVE